jgi:hypothetical protein
VFAQRGRLALRHRFADFVELAELFQFVAKTVPQWTFGTQLVEQSFGLDEGVGRNFDFHEQFAPTARDFLFGEQLCTFQTATRGYFPVILRNLPGHAIGQPNPRMAFDSIW